MGIRSLPGTRPVQGNRQDLMGLYAPAVTRAPQPEDACRQLTALGFRICRDGADHWIVRYRQALPGIHLYSARELSRFAGSRAAHYATTPDPETAP